MCESDVIFIMTFADILESLTSGDFGWNRNVMQVLAVAAIQVLFRYLKVYTSYLNFSVFESTSFSRCRKFRLLFEGIPFTFCIEHASKTAENAILSSLQCVVCTSFSPHV